MKIIKKGDLSKIEDDRRFACNRCGCVFDANSTEYSPDLIRNNQILRFACACPTCHKYVIMQNKEVKCDG